MTEHSTWHGQDPSSCPALYRDWIVHRLRSSGRTSKVSVKIPHEQCSSFAGPELSDRDHFKQRGLMTGNTFGNRKVVRTTVVGIVGVIN